MTHWWVQDDFREELPIDRPVAEVNNTKIEEEVNIVRNINPIITSSQVRYLMGKITTQIR